MTVSAAPVGADTFEGFVLVLSDVICVWTAPGVVNVLPKLCCEAIEAPVALALCADWYVDAGGEFWWSDQLRNELGSDSAVRDLRAAADALVALVALLDQPAAAGESTPAPAANGSAVEEVAAEYELDIEDDVVAVCCGPEAVPELELGGTLVDAEEEAA